MRWMIMTALALCMCERVRTEVPPAPSTTEPAPVNDERSPNLPEPPTVRQPTSMRDPQISPDAFVENDEGFKNQLRARLWKTPLGELFRAYIFEPAKPDQETEKARRLVDRIFSESNLTITRVAAIQVLTEDLYEHGVVNSIVHQRLSLLNSMADLKRGMVQATSTRNMFNQLPLFVAIGVIGGSPLMREQVGALTGAAYRRLLSIFNPRHLVKAREHWLKVEPRAWLSQKFFDAYNPLQGIQVFLNVFGSYAVVYYRVRSGADQPGSVEERLWVYGVQNVLDYTDL